MKNKWNEVFKYSLRKSVKKLTLILIISTLLILASCGDIADVETSSNIYETEVSSSISSVVESSDIEESDDIEGSSEYVETSEPTEVSSSIESSKPVSNSQPVHTHSFSKATCTEPEKCSCGEIGAGANGHRWNNATCTSPQICAICNLKQGSPTGHNYSGGKCAACGISDPNYSSDVMVWIPTNGGTKYHCKPSCSQMEDPEYVTKTDAISRGFGPCGRCKP